MKQLSGIQIARGAAALLVVIHHAAVTYALEKYGSRHVLGGFFEYCGRAGVDFFFVLSGFIMMLVHEKDMGHPSRVGKFFRKRISRIYPAYWAALAIVIGLFVFVPGLGRGDEGGIGAIARAVLLVPEPSGPILGVSWTLSHELLFYGMFAFLVVHREAGKVILGIWLAILLVLIPVDRAHLSDGLKFLGHVNNIEFFLGIGVAYWYKRHRVPGAPALLALGLVGFVCTGILELHVGHFKNTPTTLLYGLNSSLILLAITDLERAGKLFFANKYLLFLGEASYSIYLVHFPVIVGFIKLSTKFPALAAVGSAGLLVIASIVAVAAGSLFHLSVEKFVNAKFSALLDVLSLKRKPVADEDVEHQPS